jgi:hypothetical protein
VAKDRSAKGRDERLENLSIIMMMHDLPFKAYYGSLKYGPRRWRLWCSISVTASKVFDTEAKLTAAVHALIKASQ